jgi:spermidine synthase
LSPSSVSRPSSWPLLYLAVALTTSATLLLELGLTRIFSVVFYYHFAFLAISIALFGLGVGGVLSYVIAPGGGVYRKLGTVSLINSALALLAVFFVLTRGAEVGTLELALIYFTAAMPFIGSGIVVSLAISETIEKVNRVYFFDLLGAAAGCLALVALLNAFGGPNTIIAVSVLFAAAGAIWFSLGSCRTGRIAGVAIGLLFTMLLIVNYGHRFLEVRYAKGLKLHAEQFTKWNSISRIGLAKDEGGGEMIYIDADASTGIANFDFNHLSQKELNDLEHEGPGVPYNLRPGAKTLVIGPGGGWDVSRAIASGSHDVTAVEINPIIANTIMRQKFPYMSRNLYLRPDVHLHVEDGRSFVRRSTEKYQVIQATLVDTWASTAAGAFALSENNLYTTDAFHDYFTHLTPDGLLAFTRWGFDPPRESLRLVSLAMSALHKLGENEPWRHVLVGRKVGGGLDIHGWGALDTVIFSRSALSDADIARARKAFADAHMEEIYVPGDPPRNKFGQLLLAKDPAAWERDYEFDITPVSDNRPFFFYTVQPRDLSNFILQTQSKSADYKVNVAVPKLFNALIVSVIAVAIILILPPLVLGTRLPRERSVRGFLIYFLAIGMGYILIEVAMIQKFVLFLGHPTYALTVVIFSMLVSSGIGSYTSAKLIGDDRGRLVKALTVVAVLIAILALITQPILAGGVGLPFFVKVVATVLMLAPAGFAMGLPFPTGLRMLERAHQPSVRWAWSLNAAASVMGSVGALVLALYLGLIQTLLIGGALYLLAALVAAVSSVPSAARKLA